MDKRYIKRRIRALKKRKSFLPLRKFGLCFLIMVALGIVFKVQPPLYLVDATEKMVGSASVIELANAEIGVRQKETGSQVNTDLESLMDLKVLRSGFYSVDKKTGMPAELFNAKEMKSTDLSFNKLNKGKPQILIFHTHGNELYSDSKSLEEGVMGVGEELKRRLENDYGIGCVHIREQFDVVNGKRQVLGAYERIEEPIREYLKENPQIEMTIDLHRDGVNENVRLVTEIDGKSCAKVMLFNGMSRIYENGVLTELEGLKNPNLKTNLALSFNMQLRANEEYPGLMRKIYLNAYRYSLHFLPKSLLIEVGAQTNTFEEAKNSMAYLAQIIAETVGE